MKFQLGIIATIFLVMMVSGIAYGETEITKDIVQHEFTAWLWDKNQTLHFTFVYLCEASINAFWRGETEIQAPLLEYVRAGDRTYFAVWVNCHRDNVYFDPYKFTIAQDKHRFKSIVITNLISLHPVNLNKYTTAMGVISFSTAVDMTKPMHIYYDDASVEFMIPEKYHDVLYYLIQRI